MVQCLPTTHEVAGVSHLSECHLNLQLVAWPVEEATHPSISLICETSIENERQHAEKKTELRCCTFQIKRSDAKRKRERERARKSTILHTKKINNLYRHNIIYHIKYNYTVYTLLAPNRLRYLDPLPPSQA